MKQLDELLQLYQNLSQRDQKLAVAMSALIFITLFYLIIWEPIHIQYKTEKATQQTQMEIHRWMQNAASEVRTLKASGSKPSRILKKNSPVSIVAEQSASTSGLKSHIGKIESSGKNSAQIKIDNASFNQVLLWLNTLKTSYAINISSAKIERAEKDGIINARFTLNRRQ